MSEIFLFDVFVTHLRLCQDIIKDAGEATFVVRVEINDSLSVKLKKNDSTPKSLPDKMYDYLFYSGEIRYFPMKMAELIKLIKNNPLKIGVYQEGDSFPLCQVKIPLFGCACNLISSIDEEQSSKVLAIDGAFDLLDLGANFSGTVFLNIAFVNCDRFLDSYYSQQSQSFLFKNSLQGSEYECFRFSQDFRTDPCILKKIPETDWSCNFAEDIDNFIKDLIVTLPSLCHLSTKTQPIKTARISVDKSLQKKKGKTSKKKQKT